MPKIKQNESKEDFIKRCIPAVIKDGTAEDNKQAVAVCNQMWKSKDKKEATKYKKKKKMSNKIIGQSFDISYMSASIGQIDEVSRMEILQTGFVEHPLYGEFTVTKGDLEQMVENFNNKVIPGVRITAGHEDSTHELPATGWVQGLEVVENEEGQYSLIGEVKWNKKGREILQNEEFKFFSPEFTLNHVDPEDSEKEYGPTLLGGAHTNQPFFKNLKPIVASTKIINLLGEQDMAKEKKKAKKTEKISMSKKEYEALKAKAEEGSASAKELKKMSEKLVKLNTKIKFSECKEAADRLLFSNKNSKAVFHAKKGMKDKLANFMTSLRADQRESFDEIMDLAKYESDKYSELGIDGKPRKSNKEVVSKSGYPVDNTSVELDRVAKEIQASAKKVGEEISYGDAMVKAAQKING